MGGGMLAWLARLSAAHRREVILLHAHAPGTLEAYAQHRTRDMRGSFNMHVLGPHFDAFLSRFLTRTRAPPALFAVAIAMQKCRYEI